MTVTDSRQTIRIGVFIPADCQLLDMACVDILATMSHEYLTLVGDGIPTPIVNLAPNVQISCKPTSFTPLTLPTELTIFPSYKKTYPRSNQANSSP
jgi:hypothetical protein